VTMLDTNTVIYLLEPSSLHHRWAVDTVQQAQDRSRLAVSTIVLGELAARPMTHDDIALILSTIEAEPVPLIDRAAIRAGHAHARYRANGGKRERLLGDFLIGAHAVASDAALITADTGRYRRYFPELPLITPETHP